MTLNHCIEKILVVRICLASFGFMGIGKDAIPLTGALFLESLLLRNAERCRHHWGLITSNNLYLKHLPILCCTDCEKLVQIPFVFVCVQLSKLEKPPDTHFSVVQITTYNLIKNCFWNFREERTQSVYSKTSILLIFFFFLNPWFEFSSHNWRSRASVIMNIQCTTLNIMHHFRSDASFIIHYHKHRLSVYKFR